MADAITDAELAEWERLAEWLREAYALHQTAGALERLIAAERERRRESAPRQHVAALRNAQADLVGQGVVSDEWLQRAKADVIVGEAPRLAPVVKVTECVGRFVGEFEGQYVLDGDGQYRALADLMPDEAADGRIPPAEGPRGRFRITVEFWPEEPR